MTGEPHDDPAEELRELSGALAAHLSRATRRGRVRLPESERSGARRTVQPQSSAPPEAPESPSSRTEGDQVVRSQPTSALPTQPGPQGQAPATAHQQAEGEAPSPASPAAETTPTPPREGADERIRRLARASASLEQLSEQVSACTACELCETRTQTVFGEGAPQARVLFVGEGPGENEDREGRPFVGDAGKLLTDIITKGMGLRREDVYIANILKCRPPGNRDPKPLEKALCTGWLERQIELVDPEVLVPLGRHASTHLLGQEGSMGSLRGRIHEVGGRKIVPTYHPAYLLRTPSEKRACWADIQLAMAELGLRKPG